MPRVRIISDPFDLATYAEHDTDDLLALLHEQFPVWPETARLYRDVVAIENDVTPRTEEQVERLADGQGDELFYVVVYPGDPVTAIITTVAVLALTAAVLLFLTPKIPTADNSNQSSNNSLGQRSNKPRPNGRVEDIFGNVISVPTLLTVPLVVYENNIQVEYCYMSVGRGSHYITDVKDGDTPISQIAGAGVRFYGPGTSPNNGTPFYSIGTPITQPLLTVIKQNEVNGQSLRSPNANSVQGAGDIRFVYPDTIQRNGTAIDFTTKFAAGDVITVASSDFTGEVGNKLSSTDAYFTSSGTVVFSTLDATTFFAVGQSVTISDAGYTGATTAGGTLYVDLSGTYLISAVSSTTITLSSPSSINSDWNNLSQYPSSRTVARNGKFTVPTSTSGYSLAGSYTILAVSAGSITLSNPAAVNTAWNNLQGLPGGATDYGSPALSTSGVQWTGPFVINMTDLTQVVANFYAPQGMYRVTKNGKNRPASVQVQLEVTPVNAAGVVSGPAALFTATISGDGTDKRPKGVTCYAPVSTGRCQVRARRLTPTDYNTDDTVLDEVQWRDGYGTAPVAAPDFGDVTTVYTRTYATAGASSVKERKLNCRAARKVSVRNPDNTFGPALAPSTSAADIICHMALDPYIGGRSLAELDVQQIYDTIDDVIEYFGIPDAGQFSYTFDQDNISFEEMVQTVAKAVFCTTYRQGSIHRLFFERQTSEVDAILLFNHRNKVPGSETRTVRFGRLNDYDGVELDYISEADEAKLTLYIPDDQSATKPKKIDLTGVIDRRGDAAVPTLHAMRAWNQIQYQHTTTQFTAQSEASQLVLTQRVQVTDGTRANVIDGEVLEQDGLVLELSQPFNPVPGVEYVIFLQKDTGGLESYVVTAGPDEMHCTLQSPPSQAVLRADDAYALTTYHIVGSDNVRPSGFLISEKGAFSKGEVPIQAINYDDRYYANDFDFRE